MIRILPFLFLSLILLACQDEESVPKEVLGTYTGQIELSNKEPIEILLHLEPHGFYQLHYTDKDDSTRFVREKGVYVYQEGELELAREMIGFRYYRWSPSRLFVFNPWHQPYTYPADSSYYLKKISRTDSLPLP